jgi:hypothetical protein
MAKLLWHQQKITTPPYNDAKCGAACHELAATTDYVFTAYSKR